MIKTFGLTHIALPAKDLERTTSFYQQVSGVKKIYQYPGLVQMPTPGSKDILVFNKQKKKTTRQKDLQFGFRLTKLSAVKRFIKTVEKAGGKIKRSGEFVRGEPSVFFYDPDGYEILVWFEKMPPDLKSFN